MDPRDDDLEPDSRGVRAPSHHLGVVARPRRVAARHQVDRLEHVGLSRAVRTDECRDAGRERELGRRVAAEVLEGDAGDAQRSGRDTERHHHVEVVVVPDDLQHTGRQRPAQLELHFGRGEAAERIGHES